MFPRHSRAVPESTRLYRGRLSPGRVLGRFSKRDARNGRTGTRRSQRIPVREDRVKVLLDECLPARFRRSFPSHTVHSTEWAGLKGKRSGELLRAAEAAAYHVLITVDRGI